MINAQNGDQCPICRTVWFQHPFRVFLGRLLLDNLMRLQLWILFATYRLRAFWYRLPALIRFPLKAINSWFYMSNPYYQIDFILQHLTNIYPRNQILELQMYVAMRIFPVVQAAYLHVMISSGLSIALAVKTDAFYLVSELCQLPWQWQTLKVLLLWIILLSAPMTTVDFRPLSWCDRVIFITTSSLVILVRLCFAQIIIASLYGGTVYNPAIFEAHFRS